MNRRQTNYAGWANSIRAMALAALALPLATASAQDYPSKPIKMIVPYPAGGTVDIVARNIAKLAGPSLGQSIIVENVPGATGAIAHAQLARAPADGYTIGISGLSPLALAPHQYKNLAYQPQKDFAHVACFGETMLILDVGSTVQAQTVPELIAYAKAHPRKLNYGSSGLGNAAFLAAELFARDAGIELTHVPYKGNAPAMVDLIGGQIDILFDPPQTTLAQLRSGKIRSLAVTSAKRFSELPNVPTLAESGLPNYEFSIWYALIAPAGVPASVVSKLNAAVNKAVTDPAVKKQFAEQGNNVYASTPAECDAFSRKEGARWGKVFESLGLRPE